MAFMNLQGRATMLSRIKNTTIHSRSKNAFAQDCDLLKIKYTSTYAADLPCLFAFSDVALVLARQIA